MSILPYHNSCILGVYISFMLSNNESTPQVLYFAFAAALVLFQRILFHLKALLQLK